MFTKLQRALMDLVTALPKKDLANRKEIRDTILELQSELERAIVLTTVYLDGIPRIRPVEARDELLNQLSQAPMKLMDAYNEFKICAGIYTLADKFRTLLSGIHSSVHIANINKVPDLVSQLSHGEQIVIDDLRGTTEMLADAARDLGAISDDQEYLDRHSALVQRIQLEREMLDSQRKELLTSIRGLLKML